MPREAPLVAEAERRGIPIWSEVELGYRLLQPRLVGVTGTNGKTTTTELLGAILDAPTAGNVGRALTDLDGEVEPGTLRRLRALELPARGRARARLRGCRAAEPRARPPRPARLVRGLPRREAADLRASARQGRAEGSGLEGIEFSADDELPAEPLIRGAHNRENAAAATAAARALGVSDEQIAARAARPSRACRTASSRWAR